jgi:SWI/SNF-related matrix-associated actin-dependent regulator of chromatin subfamily A-like protein 1
MIDLVRTPHRIEARFRFDPAVKDLVKAAGFRWDPAVKVWWTTSEQIAAKVGRPDAVEAINAEREEAARKAQAAIEASRATDADVDIPVPAGLAYLPYQRAGIAYCMERDGALIGDDMGLGKTPQAIGTINVDPDCKRVLVICPASLKLNWAKELRRWLSRPMTVGVAEGSNFPATDIVIINYDIVAKHRATIDTIEWDNLIVDEAHYLKNPKAQRTKAILGG